MWLIKYPSEEFLPGETTGRQHLGQLSTNSSPQGKNHEGMSHFLQLQLNI